MESNDRERRKSAKSGMTATTNASALKRWKHFYGPFVAMVACEYCGQARCDRSCRYGDAPSTNFSRPRDEAPEAISRASTTARKTKHTRFASSQAMSNADKFRGAYASSDASDNDDTGQPQNFRPRQDGGIIDFDAIEDDDEMGLATQRRSKRYSGQRYSPSPTFGFYSRDRDPDDRLRKSILKRESIRLSALPAMPTERGSRRSFPAGHGLAILKANPQPKAPAELDDAFVFPRPPTRDAGMRSSLTPTYVGWNGPLDPARPENRRMPTKSASTFLLLALTFTVTFASATLTPDSLQIAQSFEASSAEVITLASALTVLGYALGAPFLAALSEKYGHKAPLLAGVGCFAIFNIPPAVNASLPVLLTFRLLAGICGAAPLIIAPAALTDLWSPIGRGVALSFFAAVTVIGPVVGAVAGSYLAAGSYPGWAWSFVITIALSVLFGLPSSLVYRESAEGVLLQRKAKRLRLMTKDESFHAKSEGNTAGFFTLFGKTFRLLAEPSLLLPTVHMSFVCGLLNLMFVSYTHAFRTERHWASGAAGLPLLTVIFGCVVGIFINFIVSKKKYTAVLQRDAFVAPEARIVPWIIGSWILPIGLLVFAWTSSPYITFVPQVMAGIPTGIGISLVLIGGLNYIVDTYATIPSLAVGANTFARIGLAFAFPLFAPRMYDALGVAWGNTTLAIVAAVLIPIPIVLLKLGPRLRGVGRFAVKAKGPEPREDIGAEMAQKRDSFGIALEAGARDTGV